MSLLLMALAGAAVCVLFLLLTGAGTGRAAIGMVAGLTLAYAAAMGWIPPGAGVAGMGVFSVSGLAAMRGWWG